MGFPSPGDELLTYDAETGLEWLDLTYTANDSILTGEGLSFFDASGGNDKFRWATASEIVGLMAEIPFASVLTTGLVLSAYGVAPQDQADASDFIDLLGDTQCSAILGCDLSQKLAKGVSRGSPSPFVPGAFTLGYVLYSRGGQPAQVIAPFGNCCFSETDVGTNVGLWLVREASTFSTPVPEPPHCRPHDLMLRWDWDRPLAASETIFAIVFNLACAQD